MVLKTRLLSALSTTNKNVWSCFVRNAAYKRITSDNIVHWDMYFISNYATLHALLFYFHPKAKCQ